MQFCCYGFDEWNIGLMLFSYSVIMLFYPFLNSSSLYVFKFSLLILPRCAYGPEFPTVQFRYPKLPEAVSNRKDAADWLFLWSLSRCRSNVIFKLIC